MIINDLANIVNNIIINLYNSGIEFYQILLGLFIYNFIVYEIVYIVKKM